MNKIVTDYPNVREFHDSVVTIAKTINFIYIDTVQYNNEEHSLESLQLLGVLGRISRYVIIDNSMAGLVKLSSAMSFVSEDIIYYGIEEQNSVPTHDTKEIMELYLLFTWENIINHMANVAVHMTEEYPNISERDIYSAIGCFIGRFYKPEKLFNKPSSIVQEQEEFIFQHFPELSEKNEYQCFFSENYVEKPVEEFGDVISDTTLLHFIKHPEEYKGTDGIFYPISYDDMVFTNLQFLPEDVIDGKLQINVHGNIITVAERKFTINGKSYLRLIFVPNEFNG